MKLWSFLFADPALFDGAAAQPLASMRVGAPDKSIAFALAGQALGLAFTPSSLVSKGTPGVICQWMGEMDIELGVLSTVPR